MTDEQILKELRAIRNVLETLEVRTRPPQTRPEQRSPLDELLANIKGIDTNERR